MLRKRLLRCNNVALKLGELVTLRMTLRIGPRDMMLNVIKGLTYPYWTPVDFQMRWLHLDSRNYMCTMLSLTFLVTLCQCSRLWLKWLLGLKIENEYFVVKIWGRNERLPYGLVDQLSKPKWEGVGFREDFHSGIDF